MFNALFTVQLLVCVPTACFQVHLFLQVANLEVILSPVSISTL